MYELKWHVYCNRYYLKLSTNAIEKIEDWKDQDVFVRRIEGNCHLNVAVREFVVEAERALIKSLNANNPAKVIEDIKRLVTQIMEHPLEQPVHPSSEDEGPEAILRPVIELLSGLTGVMMGESETHKRIREAVEEQVHGVAAQIEANCWDITFPRDYFWKFFSNASEILKGTVRILFEEVKQIILKSANSSQHSNLIMMIEAFKEASDFVMEGDVDTSWQAGSGNVTVRILGWWEMVKGSYKDLSAAQLLSTQCCPVEQEMMVRQMAGSISETDEMNKQGYGNDLFMTPLKTKSVSDFMGYLTDSIKSYENSSIDRQKLRSEILGEITSHFKRGSSLNKCNDGLLKAHDKAIKALGSLEIIIRMKNYLPQITSINSELYKFIAPLHTSPTTQFQSISSSVNVRFNLLETFVNYLTQLYDPDEHSQRITDGYNFGGADDYTIPDITDHTAALICGSFFSPNVPSDCQYKYKRRVVCLLLAVICGSRQNSEVIICPPIMDLICAALRFNNFSFLTSSTDSSVLVRTALFSCLKVIVWRLHQSNDPTVTRKLEVDNVIDYFITIIEETNLKPDASMRFLPDVFDVLQSMVKLQTNSEALKASFISMQISRRIIDICSKCPASDVRSSNQILEGALMFLYQLFKNSPDSKSDFTRNVRYERFLDVVKQFGEPTQQLLYRFLELVVESVITDPRPDENSELVLKTKDICNVELLSMLVEWIPFIEDGNTQKWLSKMLRDLSTQRERNKIVCCSAGVSETALKVITDHLLHERSPAAASYLMQLVEKLGCLSVSAADLKQMFLLIQKDNGPQKVDGRDSICITMRILRALAGICVAQRKVRALHYFSLPDQSSCIKVELRSDSHIKDTFTFHCWICVDSESWSDHKITGIRRILYRFQSASGYFESFINADGHLCIAAYKPDHQDHVYTAFIATDQRTDRKTVVADGLWHMIDISLSQRKWKVYIDAQPQHTCTLKNAIRINNHDACYKIGGPIIFEDPEFLSTAGPHTSNPRKSIKGIIGGISRGISGRRKKGQDNPDIIQNYDNEAALGNATGLYGCLGTIIVFTEQLNFKKVRLLYDLGMYGYSRAP